MALGLLVLLLIFVVPRWRHWRPQPGLMQYSDTRLFAGLPVSIRARLYWLPDALRQVAWVLLVFALARPQIGNQLDVLRGRGIDMVLAMDISGSMAALDFQPLNRLGAAKMVLGDFIAEREFDRIGLVVETGCRYFAEMAFPDVVTAGLRVARLGSSSVRYEVGLFRNDETLAAAEGFFVHVYVDRGSRRPKPLSDGLRAAMETIVT